MSNAFSGIKPDLSGMPVDAPEADRMRALIETISAYIEYFHGGSVKMESYADGVLTDQDGRRVPGLSALGRDTAWLGGRHGQAILPRSAKRRSRVTQTLAAAAFSLTSHLFWL